MVVFFSSSSVSRFFELCQKRIGWFLLEVGEGRWWENLCGVLFYVCVCVSVCVGGGGGRMPFRRRNNVPVCFGPLGPWFPSPTPYIFMRCLVKSLQFSRPWGTRLNFANLVWRKKHKLEEVQASKFTKFKCHRNFM